MSEKNLNSPLTPTQLRSLEQERKGLEEKVLRIKVLSPSAYNLMVELTDPSLSKEDFNRKIEEFNRPREKYRSTTNAQAISVDVADLLALGATFIKQMPESRQLYVRMWKVGDNQTVVFVDGHAGA
ncbi:MAG TPA: hypothetical protein PK109_00825 [Candidatus Paceibacterota bacterium]|nr:hypothetical protein [Candidatus Paceibacterota bacterium]